MSYKTLEQITQDVIKNVGLVSGTAVQNYTEPNIEASVRRMFDMLFRKRFWEWLTDWHTFTLDGTTGLFTTSTVNLFDAYEDIESVVEADSGRQILPPEGREHTRVNGSHALYYTPLPWNHASALTRVLQFWPIAATGDVVVRARTKPLSFINTDIVPFPSDVIAHAATWDLLDSDGINPPAAQKAQALFDLTYRDLVTTLSNRPIGHGGGRSRVPLTIRTI